MNLGLDRLPTLKMDYTSHAQPACPSPVAHIDHSSAEFMSRLSPKHEDTSSPFSPDVSPTRQQRLLQNRNTRFPAKKLSISGISNKLTQLIGNNEYAAETNACYRDQENSSLHSRTTSKLARRSGLSILEEISNTARNRSVRRRADIHIYQDTPERPLLQSSPYVVSSPDFGVKHDFTSPLDLVRVPDILDDMRTKNLSPSERWSSLASSPPELRSHLRKRSGQSSYDQEEYIKHLEDRLHQLEQDAYSPLSRRPVKEKLKAANKENDRLYRELAKLKEKFETEVKRTVEHKTTIEVELRRRVKDLEETVEEKELRITELQYQHTGNRLDANIVETLKSTIERLEQDKLNMEEVHESMSKRNEALTKLVVSGLSPPKAGKVLDKCSPKREKGNPRLSLILPRVPSSPSGLPRYSYSATVSPVFLGSSDISPLKLSSTEDDSCCFEDLDKSYFGPRSYTSMSNEGSFWSPTLSRPVSRRSTMHVDTPVAVRGCLNTSTSNEPRLHTKRKARRFLAGSTQLKPLLLPALTIEPVSLASTPSMPLSDVARFGSASESPLEQDADLTIIADQTYESLDPDTAANSLDRSFLIEQDTIDNDPLSADMMTKEELPNNRQGSPTNNIQTMLDSNVNAFSSDKLEQLSECSMLADNVSGLECLEPHFWSHSSVSNSENGSFHDVLDPNTTTSMAVVPLPLFSPMHLHDVPHDMPSRTPSESSRSPVRIHKKRHPLIDKAEELSLIDQSPPYIARLSSLTPDSIQSDRSGWRNNSAERHVNRMRTGDNFVDFLRRKNFAAKPLTVITIRTVYRVLSACTCAVRDFQRNPFALARRVLANAWRTNWKVWGKLSWWVLGLFIDPETRPRTRPAIDWEQYDGESIADRYCSRTDAEEIAFGPGELPATEQQHRSTETSSRLHEEEVHERENSARSGLLRSLFLWGKFSAAIMLAVGGAIVKGPNEMMRDSTLQHENSAGVESISDLPDREKGPKGDTTRHYQTPQRARKIVASRMHNDQLTSCRLDTQLDPVSPLKRHCGTDQRMSDLLTFEHETHPDLDADNDTFSQNDHCSSRVLNQCTDLEFETRATTSKGEDCGKRFKTTTQSFLLFDELSDSSCAL